ncbi:hypothetical protein Nepgr_024791 [Nepenthes gracilis]|uniref:Uncharacterized protein n=1 Tax=Nepenthes gracilis TaxID=150966 RepID=A0AAD3XZ44_NEPGR|nr:hypothetical protein Nepgr_024791 [Nepenthes gracilis]
MVPEVSDHQVAMTAAAVGCIEWVTVAGSKSMEEFLACWTFGLGLWLRASLQQDFCNDNDQTPPVRQGIDEDGFEKR